MTRRDVILDSYAEFARTGKLPADVFHPDAEFDLTRSTPDLGVMYRPAQFLAVVRGYAAGFEDFTVDVEEIYEAGDHVVVVVRDGGRLEGSDFRVSSRFADVWTFRGERVCRWAAYRDVAEALEAVGLRSEEPTSDR